MLLVEKILVQLQTSAAMKTLLSKARRFVDQEHVLMVRLSEGSIMTRVKDDQGQIFTAHSDLRQWSAQNYKCLCGQMMPCVHLIAGMMSWLDVHAPASKAPLKAYQFVWLSREPEADQTTEWHAELNGDTESGYEYQVSIHQQDEHWNIADILVHLLENYSYDALLAKDDQSIFQIVNAQGKTLNVAWWRIKWFLQRIIESNIKMRHSMMMLDDDWESLRKFQALSQQIADEHNIWHVSQSWKNMAWLLEPEQLALSACQPEGFHGDLREYQLEGIRWLHGLRRSGFGGILADDMGLGKTVQVLAYLMGAKEMNELQAPALVVVPTSLLMNWHDECHAYTPNLRFQFFHGKNKDMSLWHQADVIVTSYGMIQRYREQFCEFQFSHLILDEAQLIKNFQSQKSHALKKCKATTRFCLSGTPMENHLGELWSLMDFAVPQLLGNRTQFRKNYQNPIEVNGQGDVQAHLLARIQPFLLRRTKQQVITNLPKKTKVIQKVVLEGEQLELYETVRGMLANKVQNALAEKGLVQSRWVVLDALLKLRQICCDPRLIPQQWQMEGRNIHSEKLRNLMDMLDNLMAEGRSVLIFSQFTKMLDLIELAIQERGYGYQMLTGKTQRRDVLVNKFQKGDVPIFLLSLKAGGLGLNLTKADTVIHYEPWWNPAVSAQATDRIYRIGQEQPVFEYHLIASGTIEEYMLELQQKKHDLFGQTIEASGDGRMQWTEADIMKFFSPMG
jgi:SNF2 family DNA or RNA helicase